MRWLHNEKLMRSIEHAARLPMLIAALMLGQRYAPFLLYTVTGPTLDTGLLLLFVRVILAVSIVSAHILADAWGVYIHTGLSRIMARVMLLALSCPLGVIAAVFAPLVLLAILLVKITLFFMRWMK